MGGGTSKVNVATIDERKSTALKGKIKAMSRLSAAKGETVSHKFWCKQGGETLAPLFEFTRVVDMHWLVRFAKGEATFTPATQYPSPMAVPGWQDVPTEALVDLNALRCAELDYNALPILVLSYGWCGVDHPDPNGDHLQKLLPVLESIVAYCDEYLPACKTWGVVWDYMAFPQRGRTLGLSEGVKDDRTPEQLEIFRAGLRNINKWYAHPTTTTGLLDAPMPAGASNQTAYGQRGWCIFEYRIAAVVKDNDCYLHISNPTRVSFWPGMRKELAASRPAPMLPSAFATYVTDGIANGTIKFTNGRDATEIVIPQYALGFEAAMEAAVEFDYEGLGWQDAEAEQFAAALAHAHANGGLRKVTKVNLIKNQISDDGVHALAAVVASGAMPKLKPRGLMLSFNRANKGSLDEVKAAFKSRKESKAAAADTPQFTSAAPAM